MNDKDLTLSIIVPVYNGASTINRLFKSIEINNHNLDYEIIFVDDGSDDDSWNIIQMLRENHSDRVRGIHKTNGGIASARNTGMKASRGEFITFCDQDDTVLAPYFSFIKMMKDNNCSFLISNYYRKTGDYTTEYSSISDNCVISGIEKIDYIRNLLGGEYLPLIKGIHNKLPNSIWNCIISNKIKDTSFKNFVDYEDDWVFLIEGLLKSEHVYITSNSYYCWLVNPSSESHRSKYIPLMFEKREQLLNWVKNVCSQLLLSQIEINDFIHIFNKRSILWLLYNETWRDKRKESAKYISQSIQKLDPLELDFVQQKCENVKESVLIWLIKKGYINSALYLNRHIFKNRYH